MRHPAARGPQSFDRGAASVLVCAVTALIAALALGLGRVGTAAVAVARAETAADAAALAAAGELAVGKGEAVAARSARAVAAANGARLVGCDCRSPEAVVTVAVSLPRLPSFPAQARARARAQLHPKSGELLPECPG